MTETVSDFDFLRAIPAGDGLTTDRSDIMPPTKQRNRDPRPSPSEFLRRLGIRRSSPAEVFTASFWEEVRRAGGNPDDVERYGGYRPQAGDVYFITERIAKRSLSSEQGGRTINR